MQTDHQKSPRKGKVRGNTSFGIPPLEYAKGIPPLERARCEGIPPLEYALEYAKEAASRQCATKRLTTFRLVYQLTIAYA